MPVRTLLIDNYDRRVPLLSRSSVRSYTLNMQTFPSRLRAATRTTCTT